MKFVFSLFVVSTISTSLKVKTTTDSFKMILHVEGIKIYQNSKDYSKYSQIYGAYYSDLLEGIKIAERLFNDYKTFENAVEHIDNKQSKDEDDATTLASSLDDEYSSTFDIIIKTISEYNDKYANRVNADNNGFQNLLNKYKVAINKLQEMNNNYNEMLNIFKFFTDKGEKAYEGNFGNFHYLEGKFELNIKNPGYLKNLIDINDGSLIIDVGSKEVEGKLNTVKFLVEYKKMKVRFEIRPVKYQYYFYNILYCSIKKIMPVKLADINENEIIKENRKSSGTLYRKTDADGNSTIILYVPDLTEEQKQKQKQREISRMDYRNEKSSNLVLKIQQNGDNNESEVNKSAGMSDRNKEKHT
jgi:hypothetical protein